jgi:DNA-binding transcriptional MerR regulator
MMVYTVKQLADLAGVSRRTLRYYDEIGLLAPSQKAENGYRYYDDAAVLRLQQILFFRELGLSLEAIRTTVDAPDFDVVQSL